MAVLDRFYLLVLAVFLSPKECTDFNRGWGGVPNRDIRVWDSMPLSRKTMDDLHVILRLLCDSES